MANKKHKEIEEEEPEVEESEDEEDDDESGDEENEDKEKETKDEKPKKQRKERQERSIFVRNLPDNTTQEKFEQFFGEIGPLRRCFLITEKGTKKFRGLGIVQFALEDDAKKAVESLNGKKFADSNNKIVLKLAKHRETKTKKDIMKELEIMKEQEKEEVKKKEKQEANKSIKNKGVIPDSQKSRIIVRNIPWKCDEQQMKKHFSEYGTVEEVSIPKNPQGKLRGFSFVRMSNPEEAKRAIAGMNGEKLLGRVVAVDWAIPKDTYNEYKQKLATGEIEEPEAEEEEEEEAEEEEEEEEEAEENSEEVSEEEEEKEEEEEDEEEKKKRFGAIETSIFVRNLSFDTSREDIFTKFSTYGKVNRVYVVQDRDTGKSRGTAFVYFKDAETAEAVLDEAYNFLVDRRPADNEMMESQIVLDGRALIIARALDRNSAQTAKDANLKKKEKLDKRNLYLANEGLITRDSPGAKFLSPTELVKRENAQREKKEKLKNPNFYVSRTRLSIRNIPKEFVEKDLKKLFVDATKEHTGKVHVPIKQVKILRDTERRDVDGKARSRGYGFVEFAEHEDALAALRKVNNNPQYFAKGHPPIVEFAIENAKQVMIHNIKTERMKAKNQAAAKEKEEGEEGANGDKKEAKKSKRAQKREEKRAAKKANATGEGDKEKGGKTNSNGNNANKKRKAEGTEGQQQQPKKKQQTPQKNQNNKEEKNKDKKNVANNNEKKRERETAPTTRPTKEEKKAEKPPKKPRRESKEDKQEREFDKMVNNYKEKLFGGNTKKQTNKWFEE